MTVISALILSSNC